MSEVPELPVCLDFRIKNEKYVMKIRLLDPQLIKAYTKNPNHYYTQIEKAMKEVFAEENRENSRKKYPP